MGDTTPSPPRGSGWVNVGVAALLMVATFPGRSHGLGLLTEPILRDFPLDRIQFGNINLWASLLGALFCLPCGWLIDRWGTRPVIAIVLAVLAASVVGMSVVRTVAVLGVLILLTRGFGQSALSVVSLGIVGKTPLRSREWAMAIFAILTGVGMAAIAGAFKASETLLAANWRPIWACIGAALLLVVLPVSMVFLWEPTTKKATVSLAEEEAQSLTLRQALATPVFWAVALTCSLFLLVSSGTFLFYEDILRSFGFSRTEYQDVLTISFLFGTGFNLVCGWLARLMPMTRVLGLGSVVLAGSLAALPLARTMTQLYWYAAAVGFASGAVTVVFFTIWRPLFGPVHLGQVQGAAQMLTVLASAISQWLFPAAATWCGSYVPLLQVLGGLAAVLGVWVWFVRPPGRYTDPSPDRVLL
jgi:MFS family permease